MHQRAQTLKKSTEKMVLAQRKHLAIAAAFIAFIGLFAYWKMNESHDIRPLGICEFRTNGKVTVSRNSNVHVLLMAYPRTGSSFLGELLSLGSDVFYLFEPSFEFVLRRNLTKIETSVELLSRIFNCHHGTLEMLMPPVKPLVFYWKKATRNSTSREMIKACKSSPIKIIKTIRYSLNTAIQMLRENPSVNVKVIHLVRDPRAMLRSLRKNSSFKDSNQTAEYRCRCIRRDLDFSKFLPQENYFRIRYEDLISNVLENVVKLYEFIGSPLSDELTFYIASHKWADQFKKHPKIDEFTTYRNSNFNVNHWKENITAKEINDIEYYCGDIMEILRYEPWHT